MGDHLRARRIEARRWGGEEPIYLREEGVKKIQKRRDFYYSAWGKKKREALSLREKGRRSSIQSITKNES